MIDSAHLDKVAKAMWDTHAFPEWDEISSDDRDLYRALAQAALDALQLTEEAAFRYTHLASGRSTILEADSSDVHVARKIAGDTHELSEVSRLVSGWVRVDGGDA